MSDIENFLNEHDDKAWVMVVNELLSSIHPVDKTATCIWFAFFPVKLHRALTESQDPAETARKLLLKGKYRLADQVDSSAEFLYGHRFWPDVKGEVAEYAASANNNSPLTYHIREAARRISSKLKVDQSLLVGITAVAFGTLHQVGLDLLKQPARPGAYGKNWNKSPEQIVAERAKNDKQGVFGFLKTVDKEFSVNFRESEPGSTFKVVNMQDVTMAATNDKRDYHARDSRCMPGEGPVPVECRTSSCGTCWVGVLSPPEKIAPPSVGETNRWVYFGYQGFTGEIDSPIRLACQIKAYGNVTIVIPPWNGMIGKLDGKEETGTAAAG